MTAIPNVRELKTRSLFNREEQENAYYEGNLKDEKHIAFKQGFDIAVESVLNIFNNLEVFKDELSAAGINIDDIPHDSSYVNGENPWEKDGVPEITDVDHTALEYHTNAEKVCGTFRDIIAYWVEMDRNQIITSFLDEEFTKENKEKENSNG